MTARVENKMPYKRWIISNILPLDVVAQLQKLDFEAFSYGEGYGRREIYNYVKPEWRSREELAYPTVPVKGLQSGR